MRDGMAPVTALVAPDEWAPRRRLRGAEQATTGEDFPSDRPGAAPSADEESLRPGGRRAAVGAEGVERPEVLGSGHERD